jgi:hypothetical protein
MTSFGHTVSFSHLTLGALHGLGTAAAYCLEDGGGDAKGHGCDCYFLGAVQQRRRERDIRLETSVDESRSVQSTSTRMNRDISLGSIG